MDTMNTRRIVVSITGEGEPESPNQRDVIDTIGTTLGWGDRMPSAEALYAYCSDISPVIAKMVSQACGQTEIHNVVLRRSPNKMIPPGEKQYVRVMVYSGNEGKLSGLSLREATHVMFIRFATESNMSFVATEPHDNYPIFFQNCIAPDIATRYIEALLVDSSMCHHMAVSDAAMHHDEKQGLSAEKVKFLIELATSQDLKQFTKPAQELISIAANRLSNDTPYVSFFSIFTVLAIEPNIKNRLKISDDPRVIIEDFYGDFYKLWTHFQKWYYSRHGLMLRKGDDLVKAVKNIFDRNKYQGQVSPQKAISGLENQIDVFINNADNPDTGIFVFVILARNPKREEAIQQCKAIFGDNPHPVSWIVASRDDVKKYNHIKEYIDIIPFMISR